MYADAAKEKLAADVNIALRNRVALEGSQFVKRTVAATGFDDLALAMAVMTEQGVPANDRVAMIGVRSGIGMASNLAARSESTSASDNAYRTGLVAPGIASFDTYSDDAPVRLAAATGGTPPSTARTSISSRAPITSNPTASRSTSTIAART
jgi:hypothetical protein